TGEKAPETSRRDAPLERRKVPQGHRLGRGLREGPHRCVDNGLCRAESADRDLVRSHAVSSPKGPDDRALLVLALASRYGIVTDSAISLALGISHNAARKLGHTLERDRWLAVANRNTECKYYYLTKRTVRWLGLKEKRAKPPGPYELV